MPSITSEKIVHDQLLQKCKGLVEVAKDMWRANVDPSIVIIWPREGVNSIGGDLIEKEIFAVLPKENSLPRLNQIVGTTKAYGLFLIEVDAHALVASFESPHGAFLWSTPIEVHGDISILGGTVTKENVSYYNLLWKP